MPTKDWLTRMADSMQEGARKKELEDGLLLFMRQDGLNEKEWIRLLDSRRTLIRPLLNSLAQTKLGNFPCLKNELEQLHGVILDKSEVLLIGKTGYKPDLNTRGIYMMDNNQTGEKILWGITRNGQWLTAKVGFRVVCGVNDKPYEKATRVTIRIIETKDLEIYTKLPWELLWDTLGIEIIKIRDRRKELFEEIRKIANVVEMQEIIYNHIPED